MNNPSKKTSVVLFTHSLSGGGVQIAFVRLAEELADAGYRVAIVCQVAAEVSVTVPREKFEVYILDTPHVRQLIRPFLKFTKEWRPDVVISSLPHNNIMMIITKILSLSNWKLIITEHGPLSDLIGFSSDVRFKVLPYVIPVLYPFADAVVAVSKGIADELRRFAPRISRLVVIYNPIVQKRVSAALLDEQGRAVVTEDVPMIIGVGRLSAEKDFALLIRAFAKLCERRPAKLVILGEGPERPVLEKLARDLGRERDVSLRGWVDDLSTYYARARVVGVSSRFEGFGNVIVEALSFGTPVVATDCPFGPREILEGGKYGRLVPMGNHQAFASALEETIDAPPDPELLRGRAADFTVSASLAGYDQLIRTLVPERDRAVVGTSTRRGGPFKLSIYMNDLSGGGVERVQLMLIPTFVAGGFDVTLLLHSSRGELRQSLPPGLKIVEFGTRRTLGDLFPLARYLRRERPDLLVSSLNHNNVVAALAGLLAGLRTKVVICQHNSLSDEAKTLGWKYRVIPFLYRLLDPVIARFVAVSKGVADDMVRITGVRRDRIEPIYNPVIDEGFSIRAAQPVSHPWFENRKGPVFVTAGRLVAQKDHATLIKAFATVVKREPAKLLVLGTGPLREELEALASSLGIAEHIDFLGFKENALPYFREADAFVLSSRYEGLGNVIVEAMRCGTPVITTDCHYGPSEIVENGDFGVLVPVGDSEALAEAMLSSRWRRWTRDQLKKAVDKFETSVITLQYQSLFVKSAG